MAVVDQEVGGVVTSCPVRCADARCRAVRGAGRVDEYEGDVRALEVSSFGGGRLCDGDQCAAGSMLDEPLHPGPALRLTVANHDDDQVESILRCDALNAADQRARPGITHGGKNEVDQLVCDQRIDRR
ncbi:hypothetical protein ASF48_17190 [Rathayibacter sp. Leaf299]|nr:hypothetical protein ASF48_17190 [Rathayibacter sp. Leaf299]